MNYIKLCNHRAKRDTLKFKKYAAPAIFIMWLAIFGMVASVM